MVHDQQYVACNGSAPRLWGRQLFSHSSPVRQPYCSTRQARARAEALFGMLGWLMPRFAKGEEVSLKDQWRTRVVPRVLRREFVVG